jgi:hypothetical protein
MIDDDMTCDCTIEIARGCGIDPIQNMFAQRFANAEILTRNPEAHVLPPMLDTSHEPAKGRRLSLPATTG